MSVTTQFVDKDFDSFENCSEKSKEPPIDDSGKVIVFGGTTLSRIAIDRGWNPGSYINENFNFDTWREGFGKNNILNGDAIIDKIKNISTDNINQAKLFSRPTDDNKAFAGTIFDFNEFKSWLLMAQKIKGDELSPLNENTEIIVSSIKNIYSEYRLFVIDGNIVTASLYKRGNKVTIDSNVDNDVIEFGYKMIANWTPAKAFVLDVCATDKGMKVVEINNINSAGFYACNVNSIIEGIIDLED